MKKTYTWVNWQPMNTVPIDGTPILLYLDGELFGSRMHIGTFNRNLKIIAGHFVFDCPPALFWAELPMPPTKETDP